MLWTMLGFILLVNLLVIGWSMWKPATAAIRRALHGGSPPGFSPTGVVKSTIPIDHASAWLGPLLTSCPDGCSALVSTVPDVTPPGRQSR